MNKPTQLALVTKEEEGLAPNSMAGRRKTSYALMSDGTIMRKFQIQFWNDPKYVHQEGWTQMKKQPPTSLSEAAQIMAFVKRFAEAGYVWVGA